MVNFLNVVTHLLSRRPWTDLPATFGYTLNEPVPLPFSSVFTLYTGTNTSTGEEVSIFVYDKKNVTQETRSASTLDSDSSMHFARNCLKHLRSIRHPYVLRVLEAVDVPSGIYVATEAVRPLCLSDVPPDPSWGLYQVITAVNFLHESCGSVHRLVSPFAVFVTVDGAHWRLGTFDCMQSTSSLSTRAGDDNSNDTTLFLTHPLHASDLHPPPNLSRSPLIDRWGLRSLVTWCYTHVGASLTTHQPQLNAKPAVPQSPERLCRDLLKCSSHGTPSVSQKPLALVLKENPLFAENALVGVMLFFEEFNLKGSWEKEKFFESLPSVLRETIPCKAQYLQILPQLAHQLNFYPRPELLLPSVLLIGDQLQSCKKHVESRALTNGHSTESCKKDEETYQRHIIPVLLTFFKLPDRAVRAMLLQHLSSFETYLTVRDIEDIFDSLCLGFIDSFAALREATLRSMVYFVPKLTNPKLVDKAFQSISKLLHSDPEGALRTNAMICLAKLFPVFASQSQHAAIFRSSLLRGLKDAFPPCRTATLMAIKVAVSSDAKGVFSREELMTRFAPIICHRCVDADNNVQLTAFSVLEHILNFIKAEVMPEPSRHQTTAHGAVVLPVSPSVSVSSTTRSPVRCSLSSAFSTKTHHAGATNIEFYATGHYNATIASNCGAMPSGPLRRDHKKTASQGTQKLSSNNSDGSSSTLKNQVLLLNENDNDDEDVLGGWGSDQHDFSDPKDTLNGLKGVNGNKHELVSETQPRSSSVANLGCVESAKTTESSYFPVTRPATMTTRQSATSVKELRPTFWDDFNVGDDESNENAEANISTAGMLRSILAARNHCTKEAVSDKD